MGYVNELIPNKYYGKVHNFPKLKRVLLYNNFVRDSVKIIKKVLELDDNYFESDLLLLSDKIFEKDSYDYIYTMYDMDPINYGKLLDSLATTRLQSIYHLFIITKFLIENKIGTSRFLTKDLIRLESLMSSFKKVEDKYLLICMTKNLSELLFEYDSDKILIETNLDKYYSSISY